MQTGMSAVSMEVLRNSAANAPLTGGTLRSLPPNLLQQASEDAQAAQRWQVPVSVEVVSSSSSGQRPGSANAANAQRSSSMAGSMQGVPSRQVYIPPHCPNRVPTVANVEHIDPISVYHILRQQHCMLVDLRGEDRKAGLIEGAVHIPAWGGSSFTSRIPELARAWADTPLIIFTCQYSAHRAPQCANWYRQYCNPRQRVALLSGGFRGWEACGLPVQQLARGAEAKQADELAMRLGTTFVQEHFHIQQSQSQYNNRPQSAQPMTPQGVGSMQASAAPPGRQVYAPPHCPHRVPTLPNVEHLDPVLVYNLLRERKCLLVDLRGEDRASGLMEGAIHEPAIDTVPFPAKVPKLTQLWANQGIIVFTCQYSAHRAPQCANWYRQMAHPRQRVAILSGGFRNWESLGLPVQALASLDVGRAADDLAMQLGTQFVESLPEQQEQKPGQPGQQQGQQQGQQAGQQAGQQQGQQQAQQQAQQQGQQQAQQQAQLQQQQQPDQASPTQATMPQRNFIPNGRPQEPPLSSPTMQQAGAYTNGCFSAPRPTEGGRRPYVQPHLPNTVPTIMNVEHLEPHLVQHMMKERRCVLVDVRGEDRSAGLIDGAVHEPAIDSVPFPAKLPRLVQQFKHEGLVVFTCQYSAHRAPQCANWYREKAPPAQRVAILMGGFRRWEGEGLPVQSLAKGAEAKAADDVAMRLGTKFVDNCVTEVPGGGFCPQQNNEISPIKPAPQARVDQQPQNTSMPTYIPHIVPTIENVENIDPKTVHDLLCKRKCLLVDLRGEDRASGLIDGAVHEPAVDKVPFPVKVPKLVQRWSEQGLVVFTCQFSAHRAPQCANWYREQANPRQRVGILAGGFRGWEALGLPVQQLALGEDAHVADEIAVRLGAQFADGCVTNVPGGGFCMPTQ